MAWTHYFPFPTFRPYQEDTLLKIVEALKTKRFVILQAPCGSGKSSYSIALAHFFAKAYIATVQKQLQDQYYSEFNEHLAILKGKNNYECTKRFPEIIDQELTCGGAPCGLNLPGEKFKKISADCESRGACPYTRAKNFGLYESPNTLLNFSNLLAFSSITNLQGEPILPTRPLLILDEAHQLEAELYKFAEIDLTLDSFEKIAHLIPKEMQKQLGKGIAKIEDAATFCAEFYAEVGVKVEAALAGSPEPKLAAKLADAQRKFEKIEAFIRQYAEGLTWITKPDIIGTKLSPLRVNHLHDLAFRAGEKIVLMSGTILDAKIFARNLGIKPEDYEFIDVPFTFPPENRPVMFYPIGKMSMNHLQDTFPLAVKAITKIAAHHVNEKGVIQTYSYKICEMLHQYFKHDPRFLFQLRGSNKAMLLEQHFKSASPTILVGPGFKEGLDFKDDFCRHQTILKMPCADLSDPVVKKRSQEEPDWYALLTAMDFLQMLGRPVRTETDKAVQYVLDSYASVFYNRNRHLFPKEIRDAIIIKG